MQLFGNAGCCSMPPFPFAFPRVVSGHSPSWCARSYHGARSSCGSTRITKAHGRLGRLGLQSQHRRLHRPQEVSKLLTFSIWLQRKAAFWPQRGPMFKRLAPHAGAATKDVGGGGRTAAQEAPCAYPSAPAAPKHKRRLLAPCAYTRAPLTRKAS